jgi:hypothetical protein
VMPPGPGNMRSASRRRRPEIDHARISGAWQGISAVVREP